MVFPSPTDPALVLPVGGPLLRAERVASAYLAGVCQASHTGHLTANLVPTPTTCSGFGVSLQSDPFERVAWTDHSSCRALVIATFHSFLEHFHLGNAHAGQQRPFLWGSESGCLGPYKSPAARSLARRRILLIQVFTSPSISTPSASTPPCVRSCINNGRLAPR